MAITKARRIITVLALLFAAAVVTAWVGSLPSASWPTAHAAHAPVVTRSPNNTVWG